MAYRRATVLFVAVLAACSAEQPEAQRAPVAPAVITEETTTTSAPPTTTTTEPEPEEAPVTTLARVRPTTAASEAPRATVAPRPAPTVRGNGACGGDLPPCSVMMKESGGDPTAIGYGQCGNEDCYGKWQIHPDTAESVGYPRRLDLEDESVQDAAAAAIQARDGCKAWSTC